MASVYTLSAMTKTVGISCSKAPGPMLGENGPLEPHFVRDDSLQTALEDVVRGILPISAFDGNGKPASNCLYAFAVVDLTDDSDLTNPAAAFTHENPAYAGWNDTKQLEIMSLAKLLPLYGAYQLRADLRWLASQEEEATGLLWRAGKARDAYSRMKADTTGPEVRPRIEAFFVQDEEGKIDFVTLHDRPYDDAYLSSLAGPSQAYDNRALATTSPDPNNPGRRVYNLVSNAGLDNELARLGAREQLRMMVGWSDNVAASTVIQSLGFPYLWALALRSGLFRRTWGGNLTHNDEGPSGPGGLFLRDDYNPCKLGRWSPEERDEVPGIQPQHAGHARSVATLLTVLAQGKLIDEAAYVSMEEMLRVAGSDFENYPTRKCYEWSPIGGGMHSAGWIANQAPWDLDSTTLPDPDPRKPLAVQKVGWWQNHMLTNALLVRNERMRASGGCVPITAVLVALDQINDDIDLFRRFGMNMAVKLDQRHGCP